MNYLFEHFVLFWCGIGALSGFLHVFYNENRTYNRLFHHFLDYSGFMILGILLGGIMTVIFLSIAYITYKEHKIQKSFLSTLKPHVLRQLPNNGCKNIKLRLFGIERSQININQNVYVFFKLISKENYIKDISVLDLYFTDYHSNSKYKYANFQCFLLKDPVNYNIFVYKLEHNESPYKFLSEIDPLYQKMVRYDQVFKYLSL